MCYGTNAKYIKNNINNKYLNTKTISEMNSYEIYKHTIELIAGIDIINKIL